MWLTKNEKRILKLLISDAKLSDTSVGNKLNISSQAVGRIRKKLEEEVIKNYTLELDLPKLGINLFTICKANLTSKGIETGKKQVEEMLIANENIISLFELFGDKNSFLLVIGLKDIKDLDRFFSSKSMEEVHDLVKCTELKPISHNSIKKHSFKDLYEKTINETGIKSTKIDLKNQKYNF